MENSVSGESIILIGFAIGGHMQSGKSAHSLRAWLDELADLGSSPTDDAILVNLEPGRSRDIPEGAVFDALVSSQYYGGSILRWTYCPERKLAYVPFTNACPGCLQLERFHYVPGSKPASAVIGKANASVLTGMLASNARRNRPGMRILRPREPFDLLLFDEVDATVFGAEIKAAPLMTLPLVADINSGFSTHTPVEAVPSESIHVMLPKTRDYSEQAYSLKGDLATAAEVLLVENVNASAHYSQVWSEALDAYSDDSKVSWIRWLTNSCGGPRPRPANWPRRRSGATGYEVISDGKNSVGMDRTDDIKKAVAQILGASVRFHFADGPRLVKGIASNLPAIRHHSEYVEPLLDIVWTRVPRQEQTKDSPVLTEPATRLLDGIVTLGGSYISDEWLAEVFSSG